MTTSSPQEGGTTQTPLEAQPPPLDNPSEFRERLSRTWEKVKNPKECLFRRDGRRDAHGEDIQRPILAEPEWVSYISSINPAFLNALISICSIIAGWKFSAGNWQLGLFLCVIIPLFFILDNLRDHRDHQLEKARDEMQRDGVHSLMYALTDGTQGIGDALHISAKPQRDKQVAAARRAIMSTVRQRIGPANGVRANLFEVCECDPVRLEASKFVHDGRQNHHSTRSFTMSDESLRIAVDNNQGSYVPDTSEMKDEHGNPLPYGCYATMPVSTGDKLFGLLTVDSPNPNDINRFDGRVLLNYFASLLCMTYAKDDSAKSILITTARATEVEHAVEIASGETRDERSTIVTDHPDMTYQGEECTDAR